MSVIEARVDHSAGESFAVPSDTLLPSEHVVWSGRPAQGLILRPIEVLLIPFSLFWAGFVVFWNITAWRTNAPDEFTIFGLPFLVVGLYVTVGRFAVDIWLRRRMGYVVTNQRILFIKAGRATRSLDLKRLPLLELQERPDGRGTIRFEPGPNLFRGNGFGIWSPALEAGGQLLRIRKARQVYALIRRLSNDA